MGSLSRGLDSYLRIRGMHNVDNYAECLKSGFADILITFQETRLSLEPPTRIT
jgi:hypothetical protein